MAMNARLAGFGPFTFDANGRVLTRDGAVVPLGSRALSLLAALAGAHGRVLTKDELILAGWGDQAIEESNLTVQISAIRKALGRRSDGEEWISTVNRVGYRLALNEGAVDIRSEPNLDLRLRCAVLPFRSDARDENQVRLSEGLADDLITDLSRLPDLRVTARASSFCYDGSSVPLGQVSRELDVRYIIQGSVQRYGDNIRVNVHVIDARDSTHVWGARFDGAINDLFSLQDKIATDLVMGLAIIVRPHLARSRPLDAEVNTWFLRGRALVSQSSNEKIARLRLLFRSLKRTPSFARAHAWLSRSKPNIVVVTRAIAAAVVALGNAWRMRQASIALWTVGPDMLRDLGIGRCEIDWVVRNGRRDPQLTKALHEVWG
jgi:TolB-like protein